jgi:hypothetical protein
MSEQPIRRILVDLPDAMKFLPKDKRGYPVPRFVAWIDGEPDFRVVKPGWFETCVQNNQCWLCGGKLSRRKFFVIGPMCCITHTSAEPPSHRGCAEFAAKNCPFLTKPLAKRNDRDLPDSSIDPPGVFITRNPGCCAVWEADSYRVMRVDGGYLIHIGPCQNVTFWREGRQASKHEVMDSVSFGIDNLIDLAMKQDVADGQIVAKPNMQELMRAVDYFGRLLAKTYPEAANAND